MQIAKCSATRDGKVILKNRDEKYMKWIHGPEKAKEIDKKTRKLTLS